MALGADDVDVLRELCGDDELHFEMTRALIGVERRFRTMARRSGLFDELEKTVRRSFYEDEDDAVARARQLGQARSLEKGEHLEFPDTHSVAGDSAQISIASSESVLSEVVVEVQ